MHYHTFIYRVEQRLVSGLEYKKLADEQQALEQAEAAGFCVPRNSSKSSNKQYPEWDSQVRRDSYERRNNRTTEYWRGSGDAVGGRSTTVSRSVVLVESEK